MTETLTLRMVPSIAVGTVCENCNARPATTHFVRDGGVIAMTHGAGAAWCWRCVIEAQLQYARDQARRIPELEQELAGLPE